MIHPVPARAAPVIDFDFGDALNILDHKQLTQRQSPPVVVVGPQTYRRVEMQLKGVLDSFVIIFQPDGLHRLFSIPMHELTDEDYEAHSVLGRFISETRQRLGNAGSFQERVRVVDELLLRRALESRASDGISAVARWIVQAGGCVNLVALAGSTGLSVRQFERRFTRQVGVRPKLFARIARFEAALNGKARFAGKSWTHVAHEFGYYDQMHMIHDFEEFTGCTPAKTLTELETVFAEQIRTMRSRAPSATPTSDARLIL